MAVRVVEEAEGEGVGVVRGREGEGIPTVLVSSSHLVSSSLLVNSDLPSNRATHFQVILHR